jgi:hypothetical protein
VIGDRLILEADGKTHDDDSRLAADLHRSPAGRRWGGESSTPVIPAAHSGRSADLEPGSSGRTPNGSLRG